MSKRENFAQAAKELFGFDRTKREEGAEAELPIGAPEDASEPSMEQELSAYRRTETAHAPSAQAETSTATMQAEAPPAYRVDASGSDTQPVSGGGGTENVALVDQHRETSVISKGTTIIGRIRTDGHLEVAGKVQGNIDAEGKVVVHGSVAGNVTSEHLRLYACRIKGDIKATAGVIFGAESIVVGNIETENIVIDGKLKGNIHAEQMAVLKSQAYVLGDIKARSIAMDGGAVVNGIITTVTDHDLDSPFEEL